MVATDGKELLGDTIEGVGDGPGVYVIVRTIPEDEPDPGVVNVKTTTPGADELLSDGLLGELEPGTSAMVVVDADWAALPCPDPP